MLPQQETQFEPFHDSVSLPNEADPPATSNVGWHSTERELHDPSQRLPSCILDQPLQGLSISTPHDVTQISQDCEGDSDYGAPTIINLETSGLRRSSRIRKQSGVSNDPSSRGPTIVAYTSSAKNERPFTRLRGRKPMMALLATFSRIGSLWSFATSSMPHFVDQKCHSFVTRIS